MNIHTSLIPATLATRPDRSIPLWASVRKPISGEDWRQVASRCGLVLFRAAQWPV